MAKINIVMDMSQYDTFLSCSYKYRNRYKLHLVPSGKKNESLDKGSLIHVACEAYYQSLKDGVQYQDAVNKALMMLRQASVLDSDLESADHTHLIDIMEEYFDYWRVVDQSFEILGVEEPFMYLLYEDDDIRIYLSGKIDLRIRDNKYENQPYDHKSFSYTRQVNELSNQFRNYCAVAQSDILIVNRIGLQKTLKPHEKFLRVPISYDHLIIESWKKNVVRNIMNYLQCEAEDIWPTNETSCDKYNRLCEFYDVCKSSGEEAKRFKLLSNYMVEPWDVTKALKKSSELLKEIEERDGVQAHPQTKET